MGETEDVILREADQIEREPKDRHVNAPEAAGAKNTTRTPKRLVESQRNEVVWKNATRQNNTSCEKMMVLE